MSSRLKASILYLGRECYGERRRVDSWVRILSALGIEVDAVPLLRLHGSSKLTTVTSMDNYVPEARLWSWSSLESHLLAEKPDIVIGVTARAWHKGLNNGPWKLVLDYVDTMSENYKIRASLTTSPKQFLFKTLAKAHGKVELNARNDFPEASFVYAGYSEAKRRGALWIPNLAPIGNNERRKPVQDPVADLMFFGTLYTPINLNAIRVLSDMSHEIADRKVVIAGSRPTPEVQDMVKDHGWKLVASFPNIYSLRHLAKVAVAPLGPVTGIQNKVLEAAIAEIPQTITDSVAGGFEPGLSITSSKSQADCVSEAIALADTPKHHRNDLAKFTKEIFEVEYGVERWSDRLAEILDLEPVVYLNELSTPASSQLL